VIRTHLPVLQVVIPLLGAPLCVFVRRGTLAWLVAVLLSWTALAIAALLLEQVLGHGAISYPIGGWAAPWGIEYRIDTVSAFLLVIVTAIGALVLPFAYASVRAEIATDRINIFYVCYLLCFTGLLGIVVTGDAFNLFVFLEISSLSSYALISLGPERRALTAAYQYLIMGTIGATFILIGVGLLYMMTGTLNMADLALRIPEVADTRTVRAAFAFLTVGASLKLALFPLHLWLPNAYTFAPSAVSAFLAATATKVAVYILLRFFFTVFGVEFSFETMPVGEILMTLAVVAMLVGSIVAVFQDNVKRMLAYSSVAQIGYIVLGISYASLTGLTAGVIHLFNHALMKGGLFLVMGCIFLRLGSVNIRDLAGLAQRMPLTMAAFVVGGLALIGLPLTTGFVSKWYLVEASLEQGDWLVAELILISSLIALIYVWRVVEAAYFQPPSHSARQAREAPAVLLIPTWTLILAGVYFGIHTSLTRGVAQDAAETLLRGTGSG
jgi:multicomponent Na+:H+ antiporter subunit D